LFADDYTVARQPSSDSPSKMPTSKPITNSPTYQPTGSVSPSNAPTLSESPTDNPTLTLIPTSSPTITMKPSASPSESPSVVLITGIVDNPGRGGFDNTRNDDETTAGGLSSWAITGIVLASLAVLALIMYVRMPTKKNDEDDEEDVGGGENDEDPEQMSNEEAITIDDLITNSNGEESVNRK